MKTPLILKILIASGLLYWLIRTGSFDLSELASVLTGPRIALLLALTFLLIATNSFRWKRLLESLGRSVPFRRILPLSLIAVFFNLVTPGGIGGDVIKGFYFIKDHPGSRSDCIMSVFIDRFIGLYVLIIMAAGALLLRFEALRHSDAMVSLSIGTLTCFLLFSFIFAVSFSKKLQSLPGLRQLYCKVPELLQLHRFGVRGLSEAFLFSILSQTFQVLFILFIGRWLEVNLGAVDYFYIVPLGILASSLPVAPAGIGVGQAAFFFLVNFALGAESNLGPLSFSAFQVSQLFWAIPGALFYLLRKSKA